MTGEAEMPTSGGVTSLTVANVFPACDSLHTEMAEPKEDEYPEGKIQNAEEDPAPQHPHVEATIVPPPASNQHRSDPEPLPDTDQHDRYDQPAWKAHVPQLPGDPQLRCDDGEYAADKPDQRKPAHDGRRAGGEFFAMFHSVIIAQPR